MIPSANSFRSSSAKRSRPLCQLRKSACGAAAAELIAAHLENPIAFCVDHDAHHGRLHLGLKAMLCQDCGHVEFQVSDPSQIVEERRESETRGIQEEDF